MRLLNKFTRNRMQFYLTSNVISAVALQVNFPANTCTAGKLKSMRTPNKIAGFFM